MIGNTEFLCTQCRGFGPHLPPKGMSLWISRVAAGIWGIFSSYSGDDHSKLHVAQRSQDSCLVRTDTSGTLTRFGRIIQTLLEARWETKPPFLVSTEILGFLSTFKKSQASSPYEALHFVCLSRGQRDVRPPVQMRQTPTTFSRVSTGDSDMPSSCAMKDEPEFKVQQGNRAFF